MKDLVRQTTIAGLLHDIGKVLHRGINVDGRAHSISGHDFLKEFIKDESILEAVKYHHHQDISKASLGDKSIAYIVYLADNISSGTDRRKIEGGGTEGFDRNRAQESIYNLLNNSNKKQTYKAEPIKSSIIYPDEIENYTAGHDYNKLIFGLKEGLAGTDSSDEYVNSILEVCEAYLSYVPSSTYLKELSDISLFDHSKLTAAYASSILLYLEDNSIENYKEELFSNASSFYEKQVFTMFSCDISGIQQFIYNISSKRALKSLRARSFYLEILLENLIDEILSACNLYRTNIIYTGGGHAYMLLPNTQKVKDIIKDTLDKANDWLMKLFKDKLYIGYGLVDCSAKELMNKTEDKEAYSNIFRGLSAQISEGKLRRYTGKQIRQLNNTSEESYERECSICGISSNLSELEGMDICKNCISFQDISNKLIKKDAIFTVSEKKQGQESLALFDAWGKDLHLESFNLERTKKFLVEQEGIIKRIYSKNEFRSGLSLSTRLWMGDYAVSDSQGALKTFEELAKESNGIERIGVLRADVDDMGMAFVRGFIREELGEDKYRYTTLSRTATLSRSLSIFFKYYINDLLKKGQEGKLAGTGERNIVIVYSGGDDLFLVGAWNEVLQAALDIRNAFSKFTGGSLSISAGFGLYEPSYPISRMAAETAILEDCAKGHEYEGKNKDSISLFGLEPDEFSEYKLKDNHTYRWDVFEDKVLGEKFEIIDDVFSNNEDYGNSFLYAIIDLLRKTKGHSINIARLAYLLARHEPGQNASRDFKESYRRFTHNIYNWALDKEDRRQLITAIIIYVYHKRERGRGV